MLLDRVQGQVVYTACAVDRPVVRSTDQTTSLTFDPSTQQSCYRASVEVVVGPDGKPLAHTARIATTNDGAYGAQILELVRNSRFRPALKNGIAVHQLVRVDKQQPMQIMTDGVKPGCGE